MTFRYYLNDEEELDYIRITGNHNSNTNLFYNLNYNGPNNFRTYMPPGNYIMSEPRGKVNYRGYGYRNYATRSETRFLYTLTSRYFTVQNDITTSWIRFQIDGTPDGTAVDETMCPMYQLVGQAKDDYEPYIGREISVLLPERMYGGWIDLVTGELVRTAGHIASYAGETLPGEWISDSDVYVTGTVPTTGAEVVYDLANPVHYQLAPQTIRTLKGINNIWSNAGNVEVKYWTH